MSSYVVHDVDIIALIVYYVEYFDKSFTVPRNYEINIAFLLYAAFWILAQFSRWSPRVKN